MVRFDRRCHEHPLYSFLAATALFAALAVGRARADDTRVAQTGSAQGEIVPNAFPGGGPPHVRISKGHLIAPVGITP
jgi:hypothetical protein